jgi:hypothetical protein
MALPDPTPFSKVRAWNVIPVKYIDYDGTHYTLAEGEEFYVYLPKDHRTIYKCTKPGIITYIRRNPDGTYDTTDFDSHITNGDFVVRIDDVSQINNGKIVPWEVDRSPEYTFQQTVYIAGDEHSNYNRYYSCAMSTLQPSQSVFSEWFEGDYPRNQNNGVPERIISGFRNEGFYLYPRGNLTEIQYVPKWPGMMYLCTENRTIYAYTDGNGPVYGWDAYAQAGTRGSQLVVGMIIGWLWSPDDTIPLPPNTIKCDGTRVSKLVYKDLYAIIGDRYLQAGDDPQDDFFRLPESYNQIIFTGV